MAWDRVYPVVNDVEFGVPPGSLGGDGRQEVSSTIQLGLNILMRNRKNLPKKIHFARLLYSGKFHKNNLIPQKFPGIWYYAE